MIRLGKRVWTLAVLAAVFAVSAEAATISISPATQDANVGDPVAIDILLSGLAAGEHVGGVSLVLSFDESILTASSFTNDPDGKMGLAACEAEAAGDPAEPACEFSFGFGGVDPLDLFFLANDELDGPALKALQGTGFRLATVNFIAGPGTGVSPLTLSAIGGVFLSDSTGTAAVGVQIVNGQVCVGGNCGVQNPIPEPGTLSLLGLGAGALLARRRRKAQARG
jgi:hypothetical protein